MERKGRLFDSCMTLLLWVVGVCRKGCVVGGMVRGRWLGIIPWRKRLFVGHWEGGVGVGAGVERCKECMFEISIYMSIQISCLYGGVHVNSC